MPTHKTNDIGFASPPPPRHRLEPFASVYNYMVAELAGHVTKAHNFPAERASLGRAVISLRPVWFSLDRDLRRNLLLFRQEEAKESFSAVLFADLALVLLAPLFGNKHPINSRVGKKCPRVGDDALELSICQE